MSFSSNLKRVNGTAINNLISGRVDANAQVVGDKSGYSLTAGSYSVRASSTQRGALTISEGSTTGTASVTSVTMTRAFAPGVGYALNGAGVDTQLEHANAHCRAELTASTTMTATRGATNCGTDTKAAYELGELF